MSTSFVRFRLQTNVVAGAGAVGDLPRTIDEWKCRRVAAVVDSGAASNPAVQDMLTDLRGVLSDVQVETTDVVEPDYDFLDVFKARFPSDLDSLIGIGGGSVLDVTKAVSVLVRNPGPAIGYRGFDLVKNPGIPVVAVPSTAGTGSEITPNAVFIDRAQKRKFGINTHLYIPRLAVLDPHVVASCSRAVAVSAGLDALVHSVESFVAKGATPFTRPLSREAFSLVFNALPRVIAEPGDTEAWGRMQMGALLAASALMNAGAGPAGAMSYPLGVHFRVPHGLAGGVFLGKVAAFNVSRGCLAYSQLYSLIDGAPTGLAPEEANRAFCDEIEGLVRRLGVPESLGSFGVVRGDVPMLAEQTLLLGGALQQNPVPFGKDEALALLGSMTHPA